MRALGLPMVALVLVAGVLLAQLTHGGGDFEPLEPTDPCTAGPVTSLATGIDGLTERLVLMGVTNAACRLHVSREALTLELAQPGERTDAQIDALHQGLLDAVQQMDDAGTLPPASSLVDDALDTSDLNGLVKAAIRALPDSVVDSSLSTSDVLTRTVDDLDLRALLGNLDSQQDLQAQVQSAVTDAVKDALLARLGDLL